MKSNLVTVSRSFLIEYEKNPTPTGFVRLSRNAIYENIHLMCIEVDDKNKIITIQGELVGVDDQNFALDFKEKVLLENKKENLFIYSQKDLNDLYIYAARLEGESFDKTTYLISSARVTPISSTRMIIQEQLLLITICSVVIGLLFSFFASKKLSKPIANLQMQATEFIKGNYDVKFDGEGYREVVELADTLTEAAKQLKVTDDLRRSITANVSHDLRTPLTIIKSYAEMIRDLSGNNKEKREKDLEIIIGETDRLTELVNDVLVLSRLEAGVLELEKQEINLSALLETCLTRFEIYQMKYGYKIDCKIGEDLFVLADEKKINGVFYNLISNAINYTGEDKKVFITLEKENNKAVFKVKDTGKGISLENQKRIWEQYYRDETNHQRNVAGTGLGLSIVKNILDLHKLEYGVESSIGMGTTFYFKIAVLENNKE